MYKSNWFLLIINKNKEIINGIVKIIYVLNWLNSNKLIEIRIHEIYADNKIEINFKWPTNGKLINVKIFHIIGKNIMEIILIVNSHIIN